MQKDPSPALTSSKTSVPAGAIPKQVNFLLGGLAGMAAVCFTQPLDLVKNRMQLSGEGGATREYKTSLHAVVKIIKNEGIVGIYNGFSAGLLRQATYSTVRLGVYQSLLDRYTGKDGRPPGGMQKLTFGTIAGACGAFIGNPAEISLIRMTADGRLPKAQQRGYKNVFDAFKRIATEEGINTLWRGCTPTIVRAMVVNAAQLATYSQAKEFFISTGYFKDNVFCHFTASVVSGFVTTVASMPVDITKTRIQNMKVINGIPEYKGALDVLIKVVRNEGALSLWKGFTPYFARLGPHTVLIFIFLEQFRLLYYKVTLLNVAA